MELTSISVVIPVYNSQETIAACIESVLRQSFSSFELIIVDDGCTDDSGRICDEYVLKDPRIKVLHQVNKGRTEARWQGVQKACGEWICFVDSDDMLPVDSLRVLFEATTEDVDIVLGNGYSLAPESRTIIPMDDFRHKTVRAEGTIGVPWGSLYRRHLMQHRLFDLPRHIINGEDYLFWLRLVFLTEKPVRIVYQSVYNKGEEHTSNCFTWTADYCYELNELRKGSIPDSLHSEFLSDMLDDRLENLFAVSVCTPKNEWKSSRYYQDILSDMKQLGRSLTLKQKLFLLLPGMKIRKQYSRYSGRLGELLRFGVVGVFATALHYIIYYFLLLFTGHNIAYTVGYILSFLCNFFLSSYFTFRVIPSFTRLIRFATSHLFNYLFGIVMLNVFILIGMSRELALLPVLILAIPVNYLTVRLALKFR